MAFEFKQTKIPGDVIIQGRNFKEYSRQDGKERVQ